MARRFEPLVLPMPDSHDLAWAAGFFDGEGCFTATAANHYDTSEGRKCRRYLRVVVWQLEPELLHRLTAIFGVGKVYVDARRNYSPGHKWVCNGRAAFHVAVLLWPWIGERKKADFKRVLKKVGDTRRDFVRHPQRGRRVVLMGGG